MAGKRTELDQSAYHRNGVFLGEGYVQSFEYGQPNLTAKAKYIKFELLTQSYTFVVFFSFIWNYISNTRQTIRQNSAASIVYLCIKWYEK